MTTEKDVAVADTGAQQISRRDALRRAAVVGGALVWAAPAVQRIGMSSVFAQGTPPPPPPNGEPPPPPPPPPPAFFGISFVAFTFRCHGQWYKAKWEEGKGWIQLSANDTGLANCGPIDKWSEAIPATNGNQVNGGSINASPVIVDGEVFSVTITLPSSQCSFKDGAGVVKGGEGGQCSIQAELEDSQHFTFTANPKP